MMYYIIFLLTVFYIKHDQPAPQRNQEAKGTLQKQFYRYALLSEENKISVCCQLNQQKSICIVKQWKKTASASEDSRSVEKNGNGTSNYEIGERTVQ